MLLNLPPDPSLKDLQLPFESLYWGKKTWRQASYAYDGFLMFFGHDRKPRDIFRSDVAAYRVWCEKKGNSAAAINVKIGFGVRLYKYLDELELVEKDFNPFKGMAPKRIRLK